MRPLEAWTLAYLLNALWQVPFLFCAAWSMARIARRAGPATEHKIWVAALLAQTILPACPSRIARAVWELWTAILAWPARSTGGIRVDFGPALANATSFHRWPRPLLTLLLTAYACSVAFFAARLAWGLWRTHSLRRLARPTVFAAPFPIRTSPAIAGPVTVGLLHPTVLLPTGFLDRVTSEDFRAVLAHEGAHVRRHDFLKNALYGAATLPVAFHPALWLTRNRLAETREMICDALAAEAGNGRQRYAHSLLRLASLQIGQTPNKMFHAIGIFGLFDANSFERRLMHLTAHRSGMTRTRRIVTAAACALLACATGTTALAFRLGSPSAQSETPAQQTETSNRLARVSGSVMAGNVLTKVNPTYPPDAKAEHISGAVVLSAVIGLDGSIENLQVVSGPEKLRASALDAVRQWTYKPYILHGNPVAVQTTVIVNYSFGN